MHDWRHDRQVSARDIDVGSAVATIQVRDVPEDVAAVIAEKASAAHQSVSAYLRELMSAAVADELRQRAMRRWLGELGDLHGRLGLPAHSGVSSTELVREVRDSYESGDA